MREFDARLSKVADDLMIRAGIANADGHRRQHESLDKLLPELSDTLLPWVKVQYKTAIDRMDWWKKVREETSTFVIRGGLVFMALAFYYGASRALQHMVGT